MGISLACASSLPTKLNFRLHLFIVWPILSCWRHTINGNYFTSHFGASICLRWQRDVDDDDDAAMLVLSSFSVESIKTTDSCNIIKMQFVRGLNEMMWHFFAGFLFSILASRTSANQIEFCKTVWRQTGYVRNQSIRRKSSQEEKELRIE